MLTHNATSIDSGRITTRHGLLKTESKEKRGDDYRYYDKLNTCRETVTTVRGDLIKTTINYNKVATTKTIQIT